MSNDTSTTLLGGAIAVLSYLQATGAKVPETKHEAVSLVVSVAFASLGYLTNRGK
jgi:hypothetical protein